jgi:hypothetical protein
MNRVRVGGDGCREYRLKEKFGSTNITKRDVLSAAMYPKVFEEVRQGRGITVARMHTINDVQSFSSACCW